MSLRFSVLFAVALSAPLAVAQPTIDTLPPDFVGHSTRAEWTAFRERWGGRWLGAFSATEGVPRFLGAPGIAQRHVGELVDDVARLSGVQPSQLSFDGERVYPRHGTERRLLRYVRTWRGVPVVGDEIVAVITGDRVGALSSTLTPITGLPAPLPNEMVVRLPGGGVALAEPVRGDGVINWVDRYGDVVYVEVTRHTAELAITHERRLPIPDDLETHPARFVTVDDAVGTEVTDEFGIVDATAPFDVRFTGPRLRVVENGGPAIAPDVDDGEVLGGTDVSFEVADTAHHYHLVRDWLWQVWPDKNWIETQWDEQVSAIVDLDDSRFRCNAFYDGFDDSFSFHVKWGSCESYARVADVIYHEAGHRIHARIRVRGGTAGNIGEGSSDYIASTITGDPRLRNGPDPGDIIRDIGPDAVYPRDYVGESHNDGLIWASFLWNLRERWEDQRPDTGIAETDLLFLEALSFGPGLLDAWVWVLTADDDDADFSNGTPHDCELLTLLDRHGLGPGAQGLVTFEHTPIGPQTSDATSYEVEFASPPVYPSCGYSPPDSLTLRWTDNPEAGLPKAGEPNPDWHDIEMSIDGETFKGNIPRVPANSLVRYVVEAAAGTTRTISHDGTLESSWSFWVGDRREVWCDDLEGDVSGWEHAVGVPWSELVPPIAVDDWEFGQPTGEAGEPGSAPSGDTIVATSLAEPYRPANAEHLLTPEIDLSARGVMRLLSFQRWLSVEDGFYDRAGIWAPKPDGEDGWGLVWSNQPTPLRNRDMIATSWTHQEHDLVRLLDEVGSHPGPFRLAFALETNDDPTSNFAGWAMDDVCVVELNDPEGHYLVRDLSATVTEGDPSSVELTWTMPWIRPVTGVAVMIRPNTPPTGRGDANGVQIATLEPAAAGETMTYTDAAVTPGNWHYAILLNGRGGEDWWEDVVAGANTVSVEIGGGEDSGCSCAVPGSLPTSPASTWLVPGILGLLWAIRRRSSARGAVVALVLGLSLLASGCGGDVEGDPLLPDAGPGLPPPATLGETCGPWAAYKQGRTWTWETPSFNGATFSTTVEEFDEETGRILETTLFKSVWGDFPGENEHVCDKDGLKTVRTVRQGFQGVITEEYEPPTLIIPRDLSVGDEWVVDSLMSQTTSAGTSVDRRWVRFVVEDEQLIATPAGTWTALHVRGTNLTDGSFFSRAWRVADVGAALTATFGGNFLLELVDIEDVEDSELSE